MDTNNQITKTSYTIKELIDLPHTEFPFLWGQIIPKASLSILTGSSDCNKSTLLRQFVLSIGAENTEFLGLPLNTEHGKSIYLSTEDEHNAISTLLKKQLNNQHYLEDWQAKTLFIFDKTNWYKKIEGILKHTQIDLLVIDTWADLYDGDMNQSNKVRNSLDKFSALAKTYQCAVIIVHHKKKGVEDREGHKGDLLGSQGIEAKARTVIELKKESQNLRTLRILKGNYTPENIKATKKIFQIDATTMWLSHVRDEQPSNFGFEHIALKKTKQEELKLELYYLRDKGMSFAKIHQELSPKYGTFMVVETTLKKWINERPLDSQPIILENKLTDQ